MLRIQLRLDPHRLQEVAYQVAHIVVCAHQAFDAHTYAASFEQAQEAAAPGLDDFEANFSALCPEFGQRLFERLVDVGSRCLDPVGHGRLPFAVRSPARGRCRMLSPAHTCG